MNPAAMLRPTRWTARLLAAILAAVAPAPASAANDPDPGILRAALERSRPLLETSSRISMEKRPQCFTCHHQALPVMALVAMRDRGLAVDPGNLERQLQFTADFLARNRSNYLAGKGQGGQALTAGAALWTLEIGGRKPDATTEAVAEYLLRWQNDLDHWKPQSIRPPSEASLFASTYVALRGLKTFATPAQMDRVADRTRRARDWLLRTPAQDHEDRVFRLWALRIADAPAVDISRAAEDILATQHPDGGWSQLETMTADAYATGTAVVALRLAGGAGAEDPRLRRAIAWLLQAQHPDGSWHVATRSTPIQTFYESGYPHGEDQFISITAAGWASTALALALPAPAVER